MTDDTYPHNPDDNAFKAMLEGLGFDDLDAITEAEEVRSSELESEFAAARREEAVLIELRATEPAVDSFARSEIGQKVTGNKPLYRIELERRFGDQALSSIPTPEEQDNAAARNASDSRFIKSTAREIGHATEVDEADSEQLFEASVTKARLQTDVLVDPNFDQDTAKRLCAFIDDKLPGSGIDLQNDAAVEEAKALRSREIAREGMVLEGRDNAAGIISESISALFEGRALPDTDNDDYKVLVGMSALMLSEAIVDDKEPQLPDVAQQLEKMGIDHNTFAAFYLATWHKLHDQ